MKKQENNPTYALLFNLLKNALWGEPIDADLFRGMDAAVWSALMYEAGGQTVGPLVFHSALDLPEDCLPPRDLRIRMIAEVGRTEEENRRKERILAEIAGIYSSGGIDFFLLKGFAVAAAYPVPELRIEGDYDFYLLGEGEAVRAQELLFNKDAALKYREHRHYSGVYKGAIVENHFELMHCSLPIYVEFEKELVAMIRGGNNPKISLGGAAIPVPNPDSHILFMFDHAAFHLINGLGLRHLCDLARYLYFYRDEIDREKVAAMIKKYKYSRIVNVFMLLCADKLGMPEEVSPVAIDRSAKALKDADYVLGHIMAGGNFGHHFDERHSPSRHFNMGTLRRKLIALSLMIGNRKKHRLINPVLFRKVFSEAFISMLLNKSPDKRKIVVM